MNASGVDEVENAPGVIYDRKVSMNFKWNETDWMILNFVLEGIINFVEMKMSSGHTI
jgi:hypothetical protein